MRENFVMDLRLFDAGTNVNTTDGYADSKSGNVTPYTEFEGLSDEMKTYYSAYLIDNAEPKLIHDQFAQKLTIHEHGGKTVTTLLYPPIEIKQQAVDLLYNIGKYILETYDCFEE